MIRVIGSLYEEIRGNKFFKLLKGLKPELSTTKLLCVRLKPFECKVSLAGRPFLFVICVELPRGDLPFDDFPSVVIPSAGEDHSDGDLSDHEEQGAPVDEAPPEQLPHQGIPNLLQEPSFEEELPSGHVEEPELSDSDSDGDLDLTDVVVGSASMGFGAFHAPSSDLPPLARMQFSAARLGFQVWYEKCPKTNKPVGVQSHQCGCGPSRQSAWATFDQESGHAFPNAYLAQQWAVTWAWQQHVLHSPPA